MRSFRIWLSAARLRTLPLSISGILVGNAKALHQPDFSFAVFFSCLATAIGFQVLSNFANDYGDGVKGTDNDDRLGPKRVLQQGLISPHSLRRGIAITSIVAFAAALFTIYMAFDSYQLIYVFAFSILGICAIAAAIKYTVGSKAYGYSGWGDLFVLLFFGGLSVLGSFFLQTKIITDDLIYLALAIGLFSTGVLNVNNMRDWKNDETANKRTLVVRMGISNAKIYHIVLILLGMLCAFLGMKFQLLWYQNIWLLSFVPFFFHLVRVLRQTEAKRLDAQLKVLAFSTFLFAILIFVSYLVF